MVAPGVGGVLLAPGAGSSRDHPTLRALESALAPLPVARMDFPYRKAGRKAPDRAPVLVRAVVDEAAALAAAAGADPASLVLGGRSMGGRMCSMAVAGGLPAAGLVLLSYPLHPPGKPENLRVEHLPGIEVPVLLVSGTKDPFGTPEEIEHHFAAAAGPVTYHWVEGAGHDVKGRDAEIVDAVSGWLRALGPRG